MRFHQLVLASAILGSSAYAFQLPINGRKIISAARKSIPFPSASRSTTPRLNKSLSKQVVQTENNNDDDDDTSSKKILALVTTCCLTTMLKPTKALAAAITHPNIGGSLGGNIIDPLTMTYAGGIIPNPTAVDPTMLIGPGMFDLGSGGALLRSVMMGAAGVMAVSSAAALVLYPAFAWMKMLVNASGELNDESGEVAAAAAAKPPEAENPIRSLYAGLAWMTLYAKCHFSSHRRAAASSADSKPVNPIRSLYAGLMWMTLYAKCHLLSHRSSASSADLKPVNPIRSVYAGLMWMTLYAKCHLLSHRSSASSTDVKPVNPIRSVYAGMMWMTLYAKCHLLSSHRSSASHAEEAKSLEAQQVDWGSYSQKLPEPLLKKKRVEEVTANEKKASSVIEEEIFQEEQYKQHHHPVHVSKSKHERTSYLESLPINEMENHDDISKSYLDKLSDPERSSKSEVTEEVHNLQSVLQIEQSIHQASEAAAAAAAASKEDSIISDELAQLEMKSNAYEKTIKEDFEYDKIMRKNDADFSEDHDEEVDAWDWEHVQDMGSGIK